MASPHMVWASVLAFIAIIMMLATLLSVPFCLAKVPCFSRLVASLAHMLGRESPVPYTRRSGASGKLLRQLRVTWYAAKKADPEDPEPDSCPICFGEYATGVAIIQLACGHYFHKECIRRWLKRDACCPMCKATLTPHPQQCSCGGEAAQQPSATPAAPTTQAAAAAAAAAEADIEAPPPREAAAAATAAPAPALEDAAAQAVHSAAALAVAVPAAS